MVGLIDLPLGPLVTDSFLIQRSGIRWLVPDLHRCRAGEAVAFCNIGLTPRAGHRPTQMPFSEEVRDLQVVFAPNVAGILHQQADASLGGDLDQLHFYQQWNAADSVASIKTDGPTDRAPAWNLSFAAGRRMTELAEDRSGLLTGWHNRRYLQSRLRDIAKPEWGKTSRWTPYSSGICARRWREWWLTCGPCL